MALRKFSMTLLASTFLCALPSQGATPETEPELVNLQKYKPIYFVAGRPDTKIQLSFKVPFSRALPLYFAYTQLLTWEPFKPSAPIRDIDFNPELFYRFNFASDAGAHWLDVGIYEHESNGREGAESRAWDRVSLRYESFRIGSGTRLRFHGAVKAWVPFNFDPRNPDFPEFRGLWELELALERFLGPFFEVSDLLIRLYPGGQSRTNPLRGGQELMIRLRARSDHFLPLVVLQLFHGYAENMLDYKQERFGLRAGIGF